MAKTLDQIVQETFGAQTMMICKLQAEIELLMSKVSELEAAAKKQATDG